MHPNGTPDARTGIYSGNRVRLSIDSATNQGPAGAHLESDTQQPLGGKDGRVLSVAILGVRIVD